MLLNSYQRVERLDYLRSYLRPVLILGALSELIAERLVQDFPYQFGRVATEMQYSGPLVEHGLADNVFVDYKRKGTHYECVTMAAIKEISSKKLYCILDVSTAGIERLQRAQMYPIVLLVKFKNAKQIREIKDLRCDKISAKEAKEFYDHSLKVDEEYKHLITAYVPGGTNISYLATQAKAAVEKEQSRTLWVPWAPV